jgi:hypothetical protein
MRAGAMHGQFDILKMMPPAASNEHRHSQQKNQYKKCYGESDQKPPAM